MNNRYLNFGIVSLLACSALYAKPVSDNTAKNVAMNFVYKKNGKSFHVIQVVSDKKLLESLQKQTIINDDALKLIQLEPEGWVLISGDDVAEPILGYSLNGTFDENNIPDALEDLLEGYWLQIKDARNNKNIKISEKTTNRWKKYKVKHKDYQTLYPYDATIATASSAQVNSSLQTQTTFTTWQLDIEVNLHTPTWGQQSGYDAYIPLGTPTGCVATAMSEIMAYNQFPQHSHNLPASYTDNEGAHHYTFNTERQDEYYNWSSMLNDNNRNEIARLMQHAGISVDMDYEPGSSGADTYNPFSNVGYEVTNAMTNNFNYQHRGVHFKAEFSDSDWTEFLRTDLRQGFPIYYTGYSSVDGHRGGHAFVLEGFSSDDLAHYFTINFGWNGYWNGDYNLDSITPSGYNFINYQRAIFSLKAKNDIYEDVYEGDNTHKTASYMLVNSTQTGHSIGKYADDEDWVTFWNNATGNIKIETLNSSGDTVLYLYDGQGNQIAYDDDGGIGRLSKIQTHLSVGRYYIKVIEYNQNSTILSYDLNVRRN